MTCRTLLVLTLLIAPGCGDDAAAPADAATDRDAAGPVDAGSVEPEVVGLAAGLRHSCALRSDGVVMCWGENDEAQLGNGSTAPTPVPVRVSGSPPAAVDVGAGGDTSCLVGMDGGVYCWGDNRSGEVVGATSDVWNTPRRIEGVEGARSVAVGVRHVCVLVEGGGVNCWGSNDRGESGLAPSTENALPTRVPGLTGAMDVAAGDRFSCAVLDDGSVRCWGANDEGQLGDGTTTDRTAPRAVSGVTGAVAVVAGDSHACALHGAGTVSCWGHGRYGQLGRGTIGDSSSTAAAVAALDGASHLSAGAFFACAVVAGGEVACWGQNVWGQLGDGTRDHRGSPVPVAGLGEAIAEVAGGGWHTCALSVAGEVWCWGMNRDGQAQPGVEENPILAPAVVDGLVAPIRRR